MKAARLSLIRRHMWENWGTTKAAPGGATNTVIQGPRRLSRSRLMPIVHHTFAPCHHTPLGEVTA